MHVRSSIAPQYCNALSQIQCFALHSNALSLSVSAFVCAHSMVRFFPRRSSNEAESKVSSITESFGDLDSVSPCCAHERVRVPNPKSYTYGAHVRVLVRRMPSS